MCIHICIAITITEKGTMNLNDWDEYTGEFVGKKGD